MSTPPSWLTGLTSSGHMSLSAAVTLTAGLGVLSLIGQEPDEQPAVAGDTDVSLVSSEPPPMRGRSPRPTQTLRGLTTARAAPPSTADSMPALDITRMLERLHGVATRAPEVLTRTGGPDGWPPHVSDAIGAELATIDAALATLQADVETGRLTREDVRNRLNWAKVDTLARLASCVDPGQLPELEHSLARALTLDLRATDVGPINDGHRLD